MGHYGIKITNNLRVLSCGAGEERRSVERIVQKKNKYYKKSKNKNIRHTIKRSKDNWIGNILRTNRGLKQITEEKV
jgi:hypothetical protein